jgi:hypothetical protein
MVLDILSIGYSQMAKEGKMQWAESRKGLVGLPKSTGSTMIDKPFTPDHDALPCQYTLPCR